MENSQNNLQNWKNFLYHYNIPFELSTLNQVIIISPNNSPQYEVLISYLKETGTIGRLIIPFHTEFPPTIYQEILTEHLLHYPIK